MIVFIAPYPSEENLRDGMIQRVAAIDGLVRRERRTYLDISFRRFWRKSVVNIGGVHVFQINALMHFFLIAAMLARARCIYVHSVYNALKVLPFLLWRRFILDAHGVVPEELSHEGKNVAACLYSFVERIVVLRCMTLICVTEAMRNHFLAKHGRNCKADLILPILPALDKDATSRDAGIAPRAHGNTVIYAGGLQAWQNVDKMVAAAASVSALRYTFLTSDVRTMEHKLREAGVIDFTCHSVAPDAVKNFYLACSFGFVLREPVLVNRVACPTKLIEYLYWGVVPIVITPSIGDFDETSIRTVKLSQFLSGELPDESTLQSMREHNRNAVDALVQASEKSKRVLADLLVGCVDSFQTT